MPTHREALRRLLDRLASHRSASPGSGLLILEKRHTLSDLIGETLSSDGWPLLRCSNGKKALEIVKNEHPLAVLVDLDGTGRSGAGMLQRIRATEETRNIPIVVLVSEDGARKRRLPGEVLAARALVGELCRLVGMHPAADEGMAVAIDQPLRDSA
jgi:CheY-like chemotaxis protein